MSRFHWVLVGGYECLFSCDSSLRLDPYPTCAGGQGDGVGSLLAVCESIGAG